MTKKRLPNPTKGFLRFKIKLPYLDKQIFLKLLDLNNVFLQVVRTKQDSKKDLLIHQVNRHLLLINVEDPN